MVEGFFVQVVEASGTQAQAAQALNKTYWPAPAARQPLRERMPSALRALV